MDLEKRLTAALAAGDRQDRKLTAATAIRLSLESSASCVIKPRSFLGKARFADYRAATEGARFDPDRKVFVAPIDRTAQILSRLRDAGFAVELDPEVKQAIETVTAQAWLDLQSARDRIARLDRELRARGKELRPYQITGAEWLASRSCAILADEQGTGKTLQTLMSLPADAPVLVICPASVKPWWAKETRAWRPSIRKINILEGRGSLRWPDREGELVIVNYDLLAEIRGNAPKGCVIIADEAHKIKNPKAQRTKAFRSIVEKVRKAQGRVYALTGTPLMNRPEELWAIFLAADVAHEAFGSWTEFVRVFQGERVPIRTKDGKRIVTDANGNARYTTQWGTPTDEAIDRMRRVFLRRTKADVASDLPAKSRVYVPVSLDDKTMRDCDRLVEDAGGVEAILAAVERGRAAFEDLSRVRAALASAKIPAMLEQVESFEESGDPLLVFSWHRAPIDMLEGRDGWATITGSTSGKERERIVEAFQAGELRGLGATIQAAGTGLTLTRSSNVLFVDRSYNPADNAQAEDRVHRIGQEHPVSIIVLTAEHAIDERVQEILDDKQALINASVEAARERT